jgi:Flp pilus assembly protein TadG
MRTDTPKFMRWLRKVRLAARNWRNTSGNIAIITGLTAPVIFGAAGFGMDYGYASYVEQKMNRAAEAAVIGAVSQSAAAAMGGYSNTNGLQQYGTGLFNADIAQIPATGVAVTVTVVSNGSGGVIANASYTGSVSTFFSKIVGISTIPVGGSAQATANPPTYINYYIIVDVSQSMGIASTATDMTNLYNRVVTYNNGSGGETGCVFGCHVKTGSQPYTNEYLAHNISPTITLRIDSAVTAIQSIITDASNAADGSQSVKIGLYVMSQDPVGGTYVRTISAPSANYGTLSTLASTIDLGNNNSNGTGDSNFATELSTFAALLPSNGSGASASSPINYVFIVTDGLIDTPGACTSGHCTGAFSPSYCTALKANATVGVIYTTYLPIYNQNNSSMGYEVNYSQLAQPYVAQIPTNLQSCVSASKYYFQASDGPAINTAMRALFASTLQTPVLQK